MEMIPLFAALLVGHAVADYPLQGDFLAKAKNRFAPLPGAPWFQGMSWHAVMHGGAVWLLTGSLALGVAESICHAVIDDRKCAGKLTFNQDQGLHIVCKALWALLAGLV